MIHNDPIYTYEHGCSQYATEILGISDLVQEQVEKTFLLFFLEPLNIGNSFQLYIV